MAKKIVIASGKGGVGKTSVSIGLSKALSARGNEVLLIDCDPLRSIDILLGLDDMIVYSWGDVLRKRCNASDAVFKDDDLSFMTGPREFSGIFAMDLKNFLKKLEKDYDYIILDSPAGTDIGFKLASYASDMGIVVSTPDPVCVRSAYITADEMRKYDTDNIRLIINRAVRSDIRRKKMLNIDDVIDLSEIQLLGIVPEDEEIRHAAMRGSIYSSTQVSYRAFNNIASRIDGEYVALDI